MRPPLRSGREGTNRLSSHRPTQGPPATELASVAIPSKSPSTGVVRIPLAPLASSEPHPPRGSFCTLSALLRRCVSSRFRAGNLAQNRTSDDADCASNL